MQVDIVGLISQVQHVAQNVGKNSDKMKVATGETSSSIKEVGSSLGEIANVSLDQAKNMELGMERMGELAEHVSTVAIYTNEMTESYKDMCSLNDKVAEIVCVLTEKMNEGQQSSQEVDTVVHKVDDMTGQIGSITVTIEQIAAQTNLLALNASIEAASAIDKAKKIVEEQEAAVAGIWAIFEKIAHSVSVLNEKVEQMHTRFTTMSAKSTEVVDVFSNLSAGTKKTSAINQDVHSRMERQMDDISGVIDCAEELNKMVGQLQEKISKFVV